MVEFVLMLVIKEIIRASTEGVTIPFLCKDESGVFYWCKGVNAGLRSLRNEWICGNLAHDLGLPIPSFDYAYVDPCLSALWCEVSFGTSPVLSSEGVPYVFASRCLENVKDVTCFKDLEHVEEVKQAKILLFDEFVRNMDRKDGNSNLLVSLGMQKSLYMIDHNLAFDKDYDFRKFRVEHVLRNAIVDFPKTDREAFKENLLKIFSDSYLDEHWSEMPSVWIDDEGAEPHYHEIAQLIKGVA